MAQVFEHGGQVGAELLAGLAELLDLRQFVVEEAADEPVQFAGAGHVHPHGLFAVLEQDGDAGVLEDDVVAGVAPVEFGLDFGVQVVVAVLGLPVAASHAQGVPHRAVRLGPLGCGKFRHQHQLVSVGGTIGAARQFWKAGRMFNSLSEPPAWISSDKDAR